MGTCSLQMEHSVSGSSTGLSADHVRPPSAERVPPRVSPLPPSWLRLWCRMQLRT